MKKYRYTILVLPVIFLLVGCSDYKAKVESDTEWSGWFGNRSVDGYGNMIVDLDDDDDIEVCCTVYKNTEHGRLRVTIFDDSMFGIDCDDVETTARYGGVSVCTDH